MKLIELTIPLGIQTPPWPTYAADTFAVGTIEAEHRLRVGEVDRVFDVVALADAVGVGVRESHAQGLQLREPGRHAGGVLGALAFLLAVFCARAAGLLAHSNSFRTVKLRGHCARGRRESQLVILRASRCR